MKPPPQSLELTQVTEWEDGALRSVQDWLAAEEPLEIRIGGAPLSVTMRTPGNDVELAVGFLLTEGLIQSRDHIAEIQAVATQNGAKSNAVEVALADGVFEMGKLQRNFFAASSCGICGKASIEAVRRRDLAQLEREFRID